LEQQKAKLEAPDIGPAVRAHEAEAKAAREAAKAKIESDRATKEFTRTSSQSSQLVLSHFREGGEGALRMARGIAFLSASGSEDLRKLVQTVAVAQGAFDVFAGAFKLFANVGTPIGVAVTALGTAVVAFNRYEESLKRAAAASRRLQEQERKAAEDRKRISEEMVKIARESMRGFTEDALTEPERRRRMGIELGDINLRRQNTGIELRNIAIARRQEQREAAEARAAAEEAERIGAGRYRVGEYASARESARAREALPGLQREAAEARRRDADLRTRQIALLEQDVADLNRRREIVRERYENEFNRRFGEGQGQAAILSGLTVPFSPFVGLGTQAGMSGIQAGMQPALQGIAQLIQETQAAFDQMREIIRTNNNQLVKLRSELEQGNHK
jgi:hypothetical protein